MCLEGGGEFGRCDGVGQVVLIGDGEENGDEDADADADGGPLVRMA